MLEEEWPGIVDRLEISGHDLQATAIALQGYGRNRQRQAQDLILQTLTRRARANIPPERQGKRTNSVPEGRSTYCPVLRQIPESYCFKVAGFVPLT